jgi:hypothetical protein
MDWYLEHKLVKDGDSFSIEIYLNRDSPEFAGEFLTGVSEKVLALDDRIRKLVEDKYPGVRAKSIKLLIGTVLVATIPLASFMSVQAHALTTATQTSAASAGETSLSAVGTVTGDKLNVRAGPSTSTTCCSGPPGCARSSGRSIAGSPGTASSRP